jgi:hypothetical protein
MFSITSFALGRITIIYVEVCRVSSRRVALCCKGELLKYVLKMRSI